MAICMLIEWVRKCDLKAVCDGFTHFLKGMGTAFTGVVGLLVAAGVFAHGIKSIGAIDQLILMAEHVGLPFAMGIVLLWLHWLQLSLWDRAMRHFWLLLN